MVTKQQVKDFLNIPYDSEDAYITQLIAAGYDYLAGAIDDFAIHQAKNQAFSRQADLWIMTQWAPCMYDEREGMQQDKKGLSYIARAMLTQLQMTANDYPANEEENND